MVLGYGYINSKSTALDMRQGSIICDSCKGLGSEATISTSQIAGFNGSIINSIALQDRNIYLQVRNMGRLAHSVSNTVYDLFRAGDKGTLLIYTDGETFKVDCVCKAVTPANYTKDDVFNITLYADNPLIYAVNQQSFIVSALLPLFQFDFLFPETTFKFSEVPTVAYRDIVNDYQNVGVIWTFEASDSVINPGLMSLGQDFGRTNEYMGFAGTLEAGERIIVNTNKGSKSIYHMDASGILTNYFNNKTALFTYLQLYGGTNRFQRTADSGLQSLEVYGTYNPARSGI